MNSSLIVTIYGSVWVTGPRQSTDHEALVTADCVDSKIHVVGVLQIMRGDIIVLLLLWQGCGEEKVNVSILSYLSGFI